MAGQMDGVERPRGITIISILEFIVGGFSILNWAWFLWEGIEKGIPKILVARFGMEILMGVFYVLVGWGLWNLRMWGYQGAIILALYGLIMAFLTLMSSFLPIIPVIIHGSVLLYVRRLNVKETFTAARFLS